MNRGIAYSTFWDDFLQSVMVLWIIVTLLFLLFRLAPSNPIASYIDTDLHRTARSGNTGALRLG